MAKIIDFKGSGGSSDTPLGLTYQRLKHSDEIIFYDIFHMYRFLTLANKNPTLDNRSDIYVKNKRHSEFLHYAWELDIVDIFYSQQTRPFSNEDLSKVIPKLKRIGKDLKDVYELMQKELLPLTNSKPKRTLVSMQPQSMAETLTETINTRTIFMYLAQKAEEDMKVEKGSRPREVLSIIYPVQLLTKIWNCLDEKRDLKEFIVQEIVNLPSLKDLKYITIQSAMKRAKEKAFEDQYLRSVNNQEDVNRIRKYIFS